MLKVLPVITGLALAYLFAAAPMPAVAAMASTEEALAEKVLGKGDAPITILAFESLTCPHCATFHKRTLPRLKKEYIDTGKAKLIFSDFPLGPLAAVASMVARCAGDERHFAMIEVMFKTQASWSRSPEPMKELSKIARMGGLSQSEFEACTRNEALFKGIRDRKNKAMEAHDITSTPTFIINGKKLVGAQPFEVFDKLMKPMLP